MKNYIVTSKHPYLKEGLILDQHGGDKDSAYFVGNSAVWITSKDAKIFESDGWIKEIQKGEFTKENMIEFANWCEIATYEHLNKERVDSFAMLPNLLEWIKKNNL